MSNIARSFKHITPWFNIILLHKTMKCSTKGAVLRKERTEHSKHVAISILYVVFVTFFH